MGTDTIFGRLVFLTRTSPSACQPVETHWGPPLPEKGDRHGVSLCAGDRALDPVDLTKRRSDGRGRLQRPDMGTDTMSDMPIRNVQRETFNSQLSTG